jgi:hypothetical protein
LDIKLVFPFHAFEQRTKILKKGWIAFSWFLILVVQIIVGFVLVSLTALLIDTTNLRSLTQFILTPLSIWLAISLSVYGVGMIGLVFKKVKPLVALLRLATTLILAAVPMIILTINAAVVGVENTQEFGSIVLARMVPYYTQLAYVFALLGFFVTIWWHKAVPARVKTNATR